MFFFGNGNILKAPIIEITPYPSPLHSPLHSAVQCTPSTELSFLTFCGLCVFLAIDSCVPMITNKRDGVPHGHGS